MPSYAVRRRPRQRNRDSTQGRLVRARFIMNRTCISCAGCTNTSRWGGGQMLPLRLLATGWLTFPHPPQANGLDRILRHAPLHSLAAGDWHAQNPLMQIWLKPQPTLLQPTRRQRWPMLGNISSMNAKRNPVKLRHSPVSFLLRDGGFIGGEGCTGKCTGSKNVYRLPVRT